MRPRPLLFGVLAGVLLSALRAPKGLDWTQVVAVDAWTAAVFRAGALLAIALFLDPRRTVFRGGLRPMALVAAAGLGYAVHGLLVVTRFEPESRTGFALLLLGLTAGLRLLAGGRGAAEAAEASERRSGRLERVGTAVAGAGLAIALEALAHQTRLLGLGLPEDDAVIGVGFFVLVALGGVAFGGLVAREGWRGVVATAGLPLAAAATLQGLHFLSGMGMEGISRHLRALGLDTAWIGGWQATSALAGAAWVGAAFVLGTALSAMRDPRRLAALLLGAAVGLVARPALVAARAAPIELPEGWDVAWAWELVRLGTVVAALGAALAIAAGERGARRAVGLVLALAAPVAVASWRVVVWSFSPWYPAELRPVLAVPTAAGLVSVEPVPDGTLVVTVDRERATPVANEQAIDLERIHLAMSLLDPATVAAGANVLVVGQLTPARAALLARYGVERLDRTAPWFDAFEAVERALFGPGELVGDAVPPGEARRRLRAGEYDLVLALPVHGPILSPRAAVKIPWGTPEAPVLGGLDVPAGTVGVAWLDAASPLAQRDLRRVLYTQERFQHPSVGVVRGTPFEDRPPEAAPLLPAGGTPRAVGIGVRFGVLSRDRHHVMRQALFARLAEAARGTEHEALMEGLAAHFAAQRMSSPFETLAQRTELDEDLLRGLIAAQRESPGLDALERRLWEDVAYLLTEKRLPDLVLAYVEGVAEAFAPWPELERAVGRAWVELLEPEQGLAWFDRVLASEPYDAGLLKEAAEVAERAGDLDRAIAYVDRALEIQPGQHELVRERAILRARQGDPDAWDLLEELFRAHPEDERLANFLHAGPAEDPGGPED